MITQHVEAPKRPVTLPTTFYRADFDPTIMRAAWQEVVRDYMRQSGNSNIMLIPPEHWDMIFGYVHMAYLSRMAMHNHLGLTIHYSFEWPKDDVNASIPYDGAP